MNKFLIAVSFLFTFSARSNVDLILLHKLTKEKHTNQLEYKDSKRLLFDIDKVKGIVCSAYTPLDCRAYKSKKGFNLNIEHTWPQSKGSKFFPAQGDMHHLYVTSKESNSKRANHPFSIVYQSEWSKQGSLLGIDEKMRLSFEPVDDHKGNVARAMFYFSVRYRKSITKDKEALFRNLNEFDTLDDNELIRNNKIEKLQGNRNPFIDDEFLIEQIDNFQFI
jgi:deoxyribonuclease-1